MTANDQPFLCISQIKIDIGFSVAVFGFALAVIVFEINWILRKNDFFTKIGHSSKNRQDLKKTITAMANRKTAIESP